MSSQRLSSSAFFDGVRLRYEFRRGQAQYIGAVWSNIWGKTAEFADAAGEETGGARLVTGVRLWF